MLKIVTTSSRQCKNILNKFVGIEKTAKKEQQEDYATSSPFPHHTYISALDGVHYISALDVSLVTA
jgi:hypothetical protein